jgi:5'-3' exonuclease
LRKIITNNETKEVINTLLVDCNYLLKRSMSATGKSPDEYMVGRKNIGGIYQFMVTLRKYVKEFSINKVVLCWDGDNGGKMRYDIYPAYKANRTSKTWYSKTILSEAQINDLEKTRRSTLSQKIRIQQYCEELFIRQIEAEYIEADDIIAYYCTNYNKEEKIIIFTNDRDMCQLLENDNVNVFLDNKKTLINKDNYFLNFSHHYSNACLMKVVLGDTSDNIQGVSDCKEKTLMKHFPELRTQKLTYQYLMEKAQTINDSRAGSKPKLKPLLALTNLAKGIIKDFNGKMVEKGVELYKLNTRLVDLKQPMLNRNAIATIKTEAESVLSSEDRGSKNLMFLMNDDKFMSVFSGSFQSFVEPFYPVILKEKDLENKIN